MKKVQFENYKYYPILRTRQGELKGLHQLSDSDKDKIIPILTLGHWRGSEGVEKSIEKITDCLAERPFILDLTLDKAHQNDAVQELKNSDQYFKNWIHFIEKNPNVLPVVQFSPEATTRQIVKQAQKIENLERNPIFRIRNYQADTDRTLDCLYPLDDPSNALVIIDAGYIRDISTNRLRTGTLESIISSINRIYEEIEGISIVLAGTSYPKTVTQFLDEGSSKSGKIDMLERILYEEIGPDVVLYGDHASVHSIVYDETGAFSVPQRLDVPSDNFWYFERRQERTQELGFRDAAIKLLERFPFLETCDSWGANMIRNTAKKVDPYIKAPVTAISVRVNLHMHYQILSSSRSGTNEGDEGDWSE